MLFPYKKDPSSPCRLTVNQLAGRGGHVFLTGNSRFLSLKELAIGRLFLDMTGPSIFLKYKGLHL